MRNPQGKPEREGVLAGHFKDGRVYRPPLLAYPDICLSDWVRTDLPDLLWPLVLVFLNRDQAAAGFGSVQGLVIEALGEDVIDKAEIEFDGRLTSLERIPVDHRPAILDLFKTNPVATGSIPPQVRVLTEMYEDLPGAWLLSAVQWGVDLSPDDGFNVLMDAMVEVVSERHLNALVKVSLLGWEIQRRRVTFGTKVGNLLRNYPSDPGTRSDADAFILSNFVAGKIATRDRHPEWEESTFGWAHSFWNQNWKLLPCFPEEWVDAHEEDAMSDEEETRDEPEEEASDLGAIVAEALERVEILFNAFMDCALARDLPLDPSDAAKHEVLCGLVSRATRSVVAILRAPHMWSGEHGSNLMRLLAETQIVITWMDKQDPSIYGQYQDYGRGRAKLMRLHMETLIESSGPGATIDLRKAAERLKEKAGGDLGDEFQGVSTEANFAGKGMSLYQMAQEVDVLDIYRLKYQTTSGVVHGEWWAIEEYAMQKCMNPLHLVHNIPSTDPQYPTRRELAYVLVAELDGIMAQVLPMLDPSDST